MSEWNDFYVAVAGASAALAGLIFVGVSISLTRILSFPKLTNRALTSLILLLSILLIASALLVPGESLQLVGCILSGFGLAIWIITTRIDLKSLRLTEKKYKRQYYSNMLLSQLAVLPYIVSGITILTVGQVGLYWIVPAIMFSFIKSVLEAWVLLIEINR